MEPAVHNNLQVDPPSEPWRIAAVRCGYRATIAVPLVYGNIVYGILTLFADAPDIFDDMEETVLGELGEMIGYAINALEHRQALVSEGAVELRFRISDPSIPAIELATETGGQFEFETFIEVDANQLRVFFTGTGAEPDDVYQAVAQLPSFKRVSLLSDRDGTYRYEALVSGSGFFATLFEHGAHPRAMVTDTDEGELTVELPQSSDTKSFISMMRDTYEDVELLGRKQHDRPVLTRAEFEAAYKDRLTERQQEVLQMAYFSGFFRWPRDVSATELAELLGISQPTVSRHIRSGQREMLSLVLENREQS
jgi:predicted DNA binding protein